MKRDTIKGIRKASLKLIEHVEKRRKNTKGTK